MTHRKQEDDQALNIAIELAKKMKALTKASKDFTKDEIQTMNLAVTAAYQEAIKQVKDASTPEDLVAKEEVVAELRRVAVEIIGKFPEEYRGVQEHFDVGEATHVIAEIGDELKTLAEKEDAAESLLAAVNENAALNVGRLYAHQLISEHQEDVNIVMAGGTEQEKTAWATKMLELTKVAENPDNFDIVKGGAMAVLSTVTFLPSLLGRQLLPESVQDLGRNFLQTNDSQIKDELKECAQDRINEIASKRAALEIQQGGLQLQQAEAEGTLKGQDRADRVTQIKYDKDNPMLTAFKCTCLGILDSIQKVASSIRAGLSKAGKDAYDGGVKLCGDAKAFCSQKATAVSVATGEAKESMKEWKNAKVAQYQEWYADYRLKGSPEYKEQRKVHAEELLSSLKSKGKEPDDAPKPSGGDGS